MRLGQKMARRNSVKTSGPELEPPKYQESIENVGLPANFSCMISIKTRIIPTLKDIKLKSADNAGWCLGFKRYSFSLCMSRIVIQTHTKV